MQPPGPLVGHFRLCPHALWCGDPSGGRGHIATCPTCGTLLILPPSLKRWGPPRQQGLCSCPAQLWATSDSAPCREAFATSQVAGVM